MKKAKKDIGYKLSSEQLIAIENHAKKSISKYNFIPTDEKKAVEFDQEIKSTFNLLPTMFWVIAEWGCQAYSMVDKKIRDQKKARKNKNWVVSRGRKIIKLHKDIQDAVRSGLICPVPIFIKPMDGVIFESDPRKHKNPGKPINALAISMAMHLLDFFGPRVTKRKVSEIVTKFIEIYKPNERENIDQENIRLSLYRKQPPSSIFPPSVQKGIRK